MECSKDGCFVLNSRYTSLITIQDISNQISYGPDISTFVREGIIQAYKCGRLIDISCRIVVNTISLNTGTRVLGGLPASWGGTHDQCAVLAMNSVSATFSARLSGTYLHCNENISNVSGNLLIKITYFAMVL